VSDDNDDSELPAKIYVTQPHFKLITYSIVNPVSIPISVGKVER
jgi:hypothetical protein